MIRNTSSYHSMAQRIDGIRMSKSDRQLAKEHVQDAERMADLISRACEGVQSAEMLLSRLFSPRAS